MFAIPRAIVIAGSLALSSPLAHAGVDGPGRFNAMIPVPVERPMMLPGSQPIPDTVAWTDTAPAPGSRRRRHDGRVAVRGGGDPARDGTAAPVTMGTTTEAAAQTPAEARATPTQGPREAASPTLSDLVARHAQENGVPLSLAQAIVRIESRGNPRASHGGALGLMQIKPGTARAAGFNGGAAGLFVADTNLRFGMKILGDAFRSSGGDVCRALMQYQSGHLATRMTRSNRAYCNKARAFMAGA